MQGQMCQLSSKMSVLLDEWYVRNLTDYILRPSSVPQTTPSSTDRSTPKATTPAEAAVDKQNARTRDIENAFMACGAHHERFGTGPAATPGASSERMEEQWRENERITADNAQNLAVATTNLTALRAALDSGTSPTLRGWSSLPTTAPAPAPWGQSLSRHRVVRATISTVRGRVS